MLKHCTCLDVMINRVNRTSSMPHLGISLYSEKNSHRCTPVQETWLQFQCLIFCLFCKYIYLSFVIFQQNAMFRDWSLLMTGLGAEEKVFAFQKNFTPPIFRMNYFYPTTERSKKLLFPYPCFWKMQLISSKPGVQKFYWVCFLISINESGFGIKYILVPCIQDIFYYPTNATVIYWLPHHFLFCFHPSHK